MKRLVFLFFLALGINLNAQTDSTKIKKLKFTGDFRFRMEHDWNSQNSNGDLRNDRSRLRYRFRFGLKYTLDKYSSFGGRIRSGNLNDQQGPHVTIGGNKGEFGLVSIGLEKLYYQFKYNNLTVWAGKNSIPLRKINELFWNDNVFPEGIGLKYKFNYENQWFLSDPTINAGHFIIRSSNQTFDKDSYLQVLQFEGFLFQKRVRLFPGFYYFHRVGNFPDGQQTFDTDYAIFHIGSQGMIGKKSNLKLGVELYSNLQDYANKDSIATNLKNQTKGIVLSAVYGKLKKKGDWQLYVAYANLQKYAVVDYFAQNDWSRWDYSSVGATGSRITNFQGVEIRWGYSFKEKFNLILRSYFVEQLINVGPFKENGSRIRLDMNIGF